MRNRKRYRQGWEQRAVRIKWGSSISTMYMEGNICRTIVCGGGGGGSGGDGG